MGKALYLQVMESIAIAYINATSNLRNGNVRNPQ
jgi:hypothetical protein